MLAMLSAPPVAGAEPEAISDPMAHLKARLEEKLGALRVQEQEAASHELKVTSRAAAPPRAAAARGPSPAGPANLVNPANPANPPRGTRPDLAWDYQGEVGPAHWAQLKPEFATCASGQRQSPIDIRDGIAVELEPVRFDYRASGFAVLDTGHSVQADIAQGNSIEVMGRRYELQHLHFHRPSEERINGRQFEMSAHLVHQDAEGRLAVVAVVFERGVAQPVVQQVWNNLPLEKRQPLRASQPLDPTALLPAERGYYTYMGSLTTPPCTEGVLWMVMQQPLQVSAAQIAILSRLYPGNARPVQQTAGRLIKQSM